MTSAREELRGQRVDAVRAWTAFVEEGDPASAIVRPEILRSWERSGAAVSPHVSEAPLADEADTPSRQDVRDARTAARDKARDVAAVQADLAAANQRLQESAVEAAQATEAWNGARYRLEQARQAAAAADERAGIARTDVDRQQDAYADALVSSYQLAPTLTAVASMVQADGIGTVLEMLLICQLLQVNHVDNVPLILVGKMWRGLVDWARDSMLDPRLALASEDDLQLPQCVETADDAIALVRDFHATWQLTR